MAPSAWARRPGLRAWAPVNAPFSCPNSSLSIRVGEMAPQSTTTTGLLAAPAQLVHRVGEHLLARAALSGDEDGGVRARDLARAGQQRFHGRRAVGEPGAVHHAPEVGDLGLQPLLLLPLALALALR